MLQATSILYLEFHIMHLQVAQNGRILCYWLLLLAKSWHESWIFFFFAYLFIGDDIPEKTEIDHKLLSEAETAWAQREWSIQHVLIPAMRLFLKPPTFMATNGTLIRVSMFLCTVGDFWHKFNLESSSATP